MEEKNTNKRTFLLVASSILFCIFLVYSVSAEGCHLIVTLLNQDPYPAVPGNYVDVVFQINGIENQKCQGATFEIVPSYPFSLNEENTTRSLKGNTWISNYKTEWLIPYKLKVDKDAFDGNSTITINYGENYASISQDFDIVIQDSRTNFDAVIQESTTSGVSIAIANTGKYAANSVVVRIPEQEGFRVTGTDGQMIGNLDSGDYTIVSFSITPIMQRSTNFQDQKNNLKFDIYYTDTLGERRVVNMELPLHMVSNLSLGGVPGGFSARNARNNGFSWSNWYTLIIILIIALLFLILYKKYPKKMESFYNNSKQKIKRLFNKRKKSNNNSAVIPDWIKNFKEKKK